MELTKTQAIKLVATGRKDSETVRLKYPNEPTRWIEHAAGCLVEAIDNRDAIEIVRLKAVLDWHLRNLDLVTIKEP